MAFWRPFDAISCYTDAMSDEELVKACTRAEVVVLDGPLTPSDGPFRARDVEFRRFAPVLPLNTPGMRALTERCVRLARTLSERGVSVLETYPRAVEAFVELIGEKPADDHAYDACLCCAAGIAHVEGLSVTFGREPEAVLPLRPMRVRVRTSPPSSR